MASVREKEIEKIVCRDWFGAYDCTRVIGDIDIAVYSEPLLGAQQICYLWAEAKAGTKRDIYESLIQLIITIGKARTYEKELPPYFLGAVDEEKIAFVEYSKVMHIFSKNDFNWNVTPSDHGTKEFRELLSLLKDELVKDVVIFKFAFDGKTLTSFIKSNFKEGREGVKKIPVGKNNFTFVYYDWVKSVKDSIAIDWREMQEAGIQDCDFFLADLMSRDGMSIKEKLKVVLEKTKYKVFVNAELGKIFKEAYQEFFFRDGQKAYNQFWNRYERPPKPVYQKYILERHDLLVPQDIREIKGSYYTPEPWVRLAQEYIARALGEDWQDEYYVWDCAAGSGNLLRGLSNKYNVYASTLDDTDVKIMHDAIDGGRLNLIKNNVFQFDFLNDGYGVAADGSPVSALATCTKIPESLRKILSDPEKRSRLVVLINPPYLSSGSGKTSAGTGKNKAGATKGNKVREKYQREIGAAADEMFALFTYRIAKEIPHCTLAKFSKLKILQAPNFSEFRKRMKMDLVSLFVVPGDTFDNVTGAFPIGFHIWKTETPFQFSDKTADVYALTRKKEPEYLGVKHILNYDSRILLNDWVRKIRPKGKVEKDIVGYQVCHNNDFQNQKYINLYDEDQSKAHRMQIVITPDLLLYAAVYHAVRQIPKATWLNDRDQFLNPTDAVYGDLEFQTDCLVWSIFNNAVREKDGVCNWIPFYEEEVSAPSSFNSRFMANFLNGKVKRTPLEEAGTLFSRQATDEAAQTAPMEALSTEAARVLGVGKEIWKYYMSQPGINVNASFLDIRTYFQGYKTTGAGKTMMNSTSEDGRYMDLLRNLRERQKALEAAILPKIYEYGFLID